MCKLQQHLSMEIKKNVGMLWQNVLNCTMSQSKQQALKQLLVKGMGARDAQAIAEQAANDAATYTALTQLITDPNATTRMKSSWALAKATELKPERGTKHIDAWMQQMTTEPTQGVVRELFKALAACTMPAEHEGKFIDICFSMLTTSSTDLAVKHHAKIALMHYVKTYPELKTEMVSALQTVLEAHTPAWKVQVIKTLAKLDKMK